MDGTWKVLVISDRPITMKVIKSALKDCTVFFESTWRGDQADFCDLVNQCVIEQQIDLIIIETLATDPGTKSCVTNAGKIRLVCPEFPSIICLLSSQTLQHSLELSKVKGLRAVYKPFNTADIHAAVKGAILQ